MTKIYPNTKFNKKSLHSFGQHRTAQRYTDILPIDLYFSDYGDLKTDKSAKNWTLVFWTNHITL